MPISLSPLNVWRWLQPLDHSSAGAEVTVRLFAVTASEPVGPPQRCAVVATFPLRLRRAFVEEYPMVIASTKSAPGITGGLGTGMSKYRQPKPTTKLTTTPIKNFIEIPPAVFQVHP
jgi:hypothetical protein